MELPQLGETVAGFSLDEILGRGGFGVVFRARRLHDDAEVAVKFMRPPTGDAATPARFLREIRILSQLDHPRLIKSAGSGVLESGTLYYAMEYLRGEDLSERLGSRGAMSIGAAVEVVRQSLEALASAHETGVIHRDIKPANIFLCGETGDAEGTAGGSSEAVDVRLLDFGIATMPDSPDQETLTKTGRIVGTPKYMAPETVLGAIYSPASDVYAMGLVLYEMLTGKPPFAGSVYEILIAQARTNPEIPTAIRGEPLSVWLARAMSKDPEERYENAATALAALDEATRDAGEMLDVVLSDEEPTSTTTVQVVLSAVERLAILRSLQDEGTEADDRTISNIVVIGPQTEARIVRRSDGEVDPRPTVSSGLNLEIRHDDRSTRRPDAAALDADTDEDIKAKFESIGIITPESETATPSTTMTPIREADLDAETAPLPPDSELAGPNEVTPQLTQEPLGELGGIDVATEPALWDQPQPDELDETGFDGESDSGSGDVEDGRERTGSLLMMLGFFLLVTAALGVLKYGEPATEPQAERNVVHFRVESKPKLATFDVDESFVGRTPQVVEWPADDFPIVIHFRHPNGAETTRVIDEFVPVVSVDLPPPRTRPEPSDEPIDTDPEFGDEEEWEEAPIAISKKSGGSGGDFDVADLFYDADGVNKEIVLADRAWQGRTTLKEPPMTSGGWWVEAQTRITEAARFCMPERFRKRQNLKQGEGMTPLGLIVEIEVSPSGRITSAEARKPNDTLQAPPPEVRDCVRDFVRRQRLPRPPDGKRTERKLPLLL